MGIPLLIIRSVESAAPGAAAAAVVRQQPRLTKTALRAQLSGRSTWRNREIAASIAKGMIHEDTDWRETRTGVTRSVRVFDIGEGEKRRSFARPSPKQVVLVRRHRGWSQVELADNLGVSAGLVARWERGWQPIPVWVTERLKAFQAAPRARPAKRPSRGRTPRPPQPTMSPDDLRALLFEAGWTATALADHVGVSVSKVSSWQNGTGQPMSLSQATQVRSILKQAAIDGRERIIEEIEAKRGLTREELFRGNLGRGAAMLRFLEELLAEGQVSEAPTLSPVGRSVTGLFAGPAPDLGAATVTGAGLEAARRSVGWSRPALARRMGVSGTQVLHWERGLQRIPAPRARQIRELLAVESPAAAPLANPPRYSLEELVRRAVAAVTETPGLTARRLADQLPGDVRRRWEAIALAEKSGQIHPRPTLIIYRDGRRFTHGGFYLQPRVEVTEV